MEAFLSRFSSLVTSVLSGFDRLVFRGTLIPLIRPRGMHAFLRRADVRLLDFRRYAQRVTEELKTACLRDAVEDDRPIRYLKSSRIVKEDFARRLAADHPIDEGLVCAFTVVEPCTSFEYHRAQDPSERGLKPRLRKCLHIYKYYRHSKFGWINSRIQTWFPFNIQVCMNGREWLAHQFAKRGRTDFQKHDNCFTWLGNPALAQRWMNRQLKIDWQRALDSIARDSRCTGHSRPGRFRGRQPTKAASSAGENFARASPICTGGPQSRKGPTTAISTRSPSSTTPHHCTRSSIKSAAPRNSTVAACGHCGSEIPMKSASCTPSHAVNSPLPDSATPTFDGSSSPPRTAFQPPTAESSRPRSLDGFESSAPTA